MPTDTFLLNASSGHLAEPFRFADRRALQHHQSGHLIVRVVPWVSH